MRKRVNMTGMQTKRIRLILISCILANGPLKEGIRAVLADDSFKINSSVAKNVYNAAEAVS